MKVDSAVHGRGSAAVSRRRVLLLGAGAIASAAALPRVFADAAGGVGIGMRAFTALFPGGEGIHFDHAYYRDEHLAVMQRLYGDALVRVEMRKPLVASGEPPSPYAAIVNFWISDPAVFAAASAAHGETLLRDRAHFTNGEQQVQREEVFGEAGKPASAMQAGDRCLTVLYPHAPEDRFNLEYYRDHHVTSLIKLFGHETISRIEMRRGLSSPDGRNPPPYSCTVNIYIADPPAFAAADRNHQRVVDDIPNFTSVSPIAFQTEVVGAFDTG
jgi:uncharacterized protein (TIGR02118 family)